MWQIERKLNFRDINICVCNSYNLLNNFYKFDYNGIVIIEVIQEIISVDKQVSLTARKYATQNTISKVNYKLIEVGYIADEHEHL